MTRNRKIFRRFARNEDGSNAVEAALVMPLIIMAMFALFHLAIFFYSTHQAQRATEQAGRDVRLLSNPTSAQIEDVLEDRLNLPISGTYTPVITEINQFDETFADIRIQYEYALPIPFLDKHTFKSESGTRVLLRDLS